MQPLGTKVYLLKRYSPSDSFYIFFSESVGLASYRRPKCTVNQHSNIKLIIKYELYNLSFPIQTVPGLRTKYRHDIIREKPCFNILVQSRNIPTCNVAIC